MIIGQKMILELQTDREIFIDWIGRRIDHIVGRDYGCIPTDTITEGRPVFGEGGTCVGTEPIQVDYRDAREATKGRYIRKMITRIHGEYDRAPKLTPEKIQALIDRFTRRLHVIAEAPLRGAHVTMPRLDTALLWFKDRLEDVIPEDFEFADVGTRQFYEADEGTEDPV